MIKEFLHTIRMKTVSNRRWQKSRIIRPFLKYIYWHLPQKLRGSRIVHDTIYSLTKKKNIPIKFIQIGANDGIHSDPLYKYLKQLEWKGLMLEPNPGTFEKLKKNHIDSVAELQFQPLAIGDFGNFTLYYCTENLGMASTDRDHVMKHRAGNDWEIREANVDMIPFNTLIEKHPDFSNIDLLLIDTEGWDAKIVLSIDFAEFKSDLIIFEYVHIAPNVLSEVREFLHKNAYDVFIGELDLVAISRNTTNEALDRIRHRSGSLLFEN